MLRYSALVLFVLACLVGCGPAGEPAPPDPPKVYRSGETPEETLEQFIEAQRGRLRCCQSNDLPG